MCPHRGAAEGRKAGILRNEWMLDEVPDLVLAFASDIEKSRGTRHCALEAHRRGLPLEIWQMKATPVLRFNMPRPHLAGPRSLGGHHGPNHEVRRGVRLPVELFESPIKARTFDLSAPTVEHAYQACKTRDREAQAWIIAAETPGRAKRRGAQVTLREDWDQIRIEVMQKLIFLKFTRHRNLGDRLIATGDAVLIEGNTWGDRFWGQSPLGEGENMLGILLMELREALVTDRLVRDAHIRERVNHG